MEKGKFGVSLAFYGVAGFVLAMLGWTTGLFLLAGVVLIGEKNEWASRQIIQALGLSMVTSLVSVAFDVLGFMDWFGWASYGSGLYAVSSVWSRVESVIFFALRIVVYIFALLAILKNAKGQEADVPVFSKFAYWAYGKVVVKPQPVYQQPVQQAPVQQAAPAAPVAPAPAAEPTPAAGTCANCGAPLNGGAFCTKCGTPVAK